MEIVILVDDKKPSVMVKQSLIPPTVHQSMHFQQNSDKRSIPPPSPLAEHGLIFNGEMWAFYVTFYLLSFTTSWGKRCVHFYGLQLSVFIMHAIFNLNDNLFNIYMCSTDVTLKVCLQLFHLFLVISSHQTNVFTFVIIKDVKKPLCEIPAILFAISGQRAAGGSGGESLWASGELGLVGPFLGEHLHYGLTEGWVQKFKASNLAYFLQCALTDYASGKA